MNNDSREKIVFVVIILIITIIGIIIPVLCNHQMH